MPTRRQLISAAALALFTSIAPAQTSYPERDVSAVIQWGAGGPTDLVMRAYTPYAEEALGKKIILQNRPGATGAIGANFVMQQPADGYTLLMGAEPQSLFRVMGLAQFDYAQFYPINIAAVANTILLVTNNNKPWNTTQELLDHVKANPNKVKQYIAGQGTVPFTVNAMVNSLTKFDTIKVPFDGDGPAIVALQGGHIDIGFMASGSAIEHIKAGRLKALGVLSDQAYQGIAPMTEVSALKALPKYLPWGSWYGVFVRKDTPEPVKAKLVAAFNKAGDNPQFRQLMESRGTTMLNISGAEAQAFINRFQSTTAWLYQDAGVAKVNPADLGIAKP